ncbi:hypothetical protein [Actinomycetospora atypica]|uniref:Pullulanase n=1 Tax=Actinomycetospora atypica TaxID=1290095 RepID=A0ABV9YVM6_9PSEU
MITYHFGTGRGPVHRHRSPADLALGGPAPDAVALDFDGDGRVDDALWDSDGDGAADRALLDLDDDDRPEAAFVDPAGRGTWAARDPGAPGGRIAPELDTDDDGVPDGRSAAGRVLCDLDGDGRADQLLVDHDGDGRAESAYAGSSTSRWDVLLADTDSDGLVDAAVGEGGPGWVPP